jgi:hypothetical protein
MGLKQTGISIGTYQDSGLNSTAPTLPGDPFWVITAISGEQMFASGIAP